MVACHSVFENQDSHLLVTFHGRVSPQDLVRLADEMDVVEDSLPAALDRASDLTNVIEFDVGYTEVRALAVRRRMRTFERNIKSAIVANSELQMGMARMFPGAE